MERVTRLMYGRLQYQSESEGGNLAMRDHIWLAAEHWREEDLDVTKKRRGHGVSICLRRQTPFPLPAPGARGRAHTPERVMDAEALRQQKEDEDRRKEARHHLLHLCPCTQGSACQRRLTLQNSVPLPEVDQDAHAWLRAIMRGPESVRYELLKHARRLQWTVRVDVDHFAPADVGTAQDGTVFVTGPLTLLAGRRTLTQSTPNESAASDASSKGKRTTSEEKRARGDVRRVAPSLSAEQLDSLAQVQVSLAALQEQNSTLTAENVSALSRNMQLELTLAAQNEEIAARKAREITLLSQVADMRQSLARAEAAEAAATAQRPVAEQISMAEQRWAQATNSVQLCLTWTGLLGPERLEALAELVEGVPENIILKLPQVRAAIDRLNLRRAASDSTDTAEEDAVEEADDVYLEDDDSPPPAASEVASAAGSGAAAAATDAAKAGASDAADAMDANDDSAEHDRVLEAYPVRWSECYARVRNAGERVLTSRSRLLLTLVFLRLVHNADVVAAFFGVSRSVCVRVYRRTLCELAAVARVYGSWPSWTKLVELTSPAEQGTYGIGPDAGVLYGDCTGVKCFRPSSLAIARGLYSSYYGMCCFKYLVIVAPNGYVYFHYFLFIELYCLAVSQLMPFVPTLVP